MSGKTLQFVVPGDPVALGRARVTSIGGKPRMFTPKKSADHKRVVAMLAKAAGAQVVADFPVILDVAAVWAWPKAWSHGRVAGERAGMAAIADYLGPGKKTRPDADNLAKLAADALNGIAYQDDGQVWLVRCAKVYGNRDETHVRVIYADSDQDAPRFARWWSP